MKRILEVPSKRRRAEFLAAVKSSRRLHGHWASPPRAAKAFNKSLERSSFKAHVGYWVVAESGELAGAINLTRLFEAAFGQATWATMPLCRTMVAAT